MDKWVVHKFGGSSVADAGCFQRVADIVEKSANPREAVVLSACRGVTDDLLALVSPRREAATAISRRPSTQSRRGTPIWRAPCCRRLARAAFSAELEGDIRDIAGMLQTVRLIRSAPESVRDVVAGFGELWSTRLFSSYLIERAGIKGEVLWVDSRLVVVVEWGSLGPAVQWQSSERNLYSLVPHPFTGRLVLPGYVATTPQGHPDHPRPQRQRLLRLDLRRVAERGRDPSSGRTWTGCCRRIRGWCRTPR